MAKDDEPKESVKEPIKSLVKEIVRDTVYKLAKAAAKKTAIEFRDRLKEEAARRFEEKLKETAEKKLKQTAQKLEKEFTRDAPRETEYIKKLEESLGKRLRQCLSPLSQGLFKTIIIAGIGGAIAGAAIAGGIVYICTQPPPTQPQPDLVISEITFEVEPATETSFSTEKVPTELDALSLWPWGDNTLYQVTVHYVIANQGEAEAKQSTSCLYLNGEPATEDLVGTLPAGERAEGAFEDYPLFPDVISSFFESGYIEIKLRADAGGEIEESNEENNTATLTVNLSQ